MYQQILWYSQLGTGLGKEKNLVKNPQFALKCSPDISGLRDGGILRCSKELWLFLNLDLSTSKHPPPPELKFIMGISKLIDFFMTLDFEYLKTPLEYNIDFIFYFRFESINSPSFPTLWESVETTLHQLTKNTLAPRKSGTGSWRTRGHCIYEHTTDVWSIPRTPPNPYPKLELHMEDLGTLDLSLPRMPSLPKNWNCSWKT